MASETGDPLEEVAAHLRLTVGPEFTAEAVENETLTELGRVRRSDLAARLTALQHRGDRVDVLTSDRTLFGDIDQVGSDYVSVSTESDRIDAPLSSIIVRPHRRTSGGHSTKPGAATLRARLSEYEQTGESVRIVTTIVEGEVAGTISVVGVDHLELDDGSDISLIPISTIRLVLRRR